MKNATGFFCLVVGAALVCAPARADELPEVRRGVVTLGLHTNPLPIFIDGHRPPLGLAVGIWPLHQLGVEIVGAVIPAGRELSPSLLARSAPLTRYAYVEPDWLLSVETLDPVGSLRFNLVGAPFHGRLGLPTGPAASFDLLLGGGFALHLLRVSHLRQDGTRLESLPVRRFHTWTSLDLLVGTRVLLSERFALRFTLHGLIGSHLAAREGQNRPWGGQGFKGEVSSCPELSSCAQVPHIRIEPRLGGEFGLGKGLRAPPPRGPTRAAREQLQGRDLLELSLAGSLQGTAGLNSWLGLGLRGSVLFRGLLGVDVAGFDVLEAGAPGGSYLSTMKLGWLGGERPPSSVPQGFGEAALIVAPLRGFFPLAGAALGEAAVHLRLGSGILGTLDLPHDLRTRCTATRDASSVYYGRYDTDCVVQQQVHPMLVWGIGARVSLGGFLLRLDLDGYLHPEDILVGATVLRQARVGARGVLSIGGSIRIRPR